MRAILFKLLLPVVAIYGIIQPFYSLCVYIAFTIVRPEMFFWGSRGNNLIFKVSLIATFIGFFRLRRNPRSVLSYKEFWLILWIWLASVISLWNANIIAPRSWYYSNELFKLWVLGFLILGTVYTQKRFFQIQRLSLFCISFLSLWGIDQHFRGNKRLEGMGVSDSNGLAAVAVLFFAIALNNLLTAKDKKSKVLWLISSGLIVSLIIFSQSRGGLVGLFASILYLVFRTRKKKMLIIACIIATTVIAPFLAKKYMNRMETITSENKPRDYSSSSRLVLWQTGILMFKDHPFIGVGTLNFATEKAPYRSKLDGKFDADLLDYSFRGYKVGHGTFFTQLLAEGGLLQTIPYLWLIGNFLFGAIRVSSTKKVKNNEALCDLLAGMEAGVVGHCVSIMFINALFMYFLPIQLLIGSQIIHYLEKDKPLQP